LKRRIDVQLIGSAGRIVSPHAQHIACARNREGEAAGDDLLLHRMQSEVEVRDDAEIAAAAADAPQQVGMIARTGAYHAAVRGHDVHRFEIVDRHAEATRESTEAAAQRQSANAGVRDRPERRDESLCIRCAIDLTE
jgi:hypothetical protein